MNTAFSALHLEDISLAGICMPMDRFSPAWSLSAKCMDKNIVLGKTTRINGLNGWIAAFFGLFAVFIAGQIIDTSGRRPVLIAFLSSNIVVKALLFISCFTPYSIFVVTWQIFLQINFRVKIDVLEQTGIIFFFKQTLRPFSFCRMSLKLPLQLVLNQH